MCLCVWYGFVCLLVCLSFVCCVEVDVTCLGFVRYYRVCCVFGVVFVCCYVLVGLLVVVCFLGLFVCYFVLRYCLVWFGLVGFGCGLCVDDL